MPYAAISHPSLALGLLKSALTAAGIRAEVLDANLLFAEYIGLPAYRMVTSISTLYLLGEWTFAQAAFPDHATDEQAYVQRLVAAIGDGAALSWLNQKKPEEIQRDLLAVRSAATDFTQRLAQRVMARHPRIVGCTSTLVQHVPSLALLRAVRNCSEEVATLIGGANCEQEMGVVTVREFPWVDLVFSGEADEEFPRLCRRLLDHDRQLPGSALLPGVISRSRAVSLTRQGRVTEPNIPRATVHHLDNVPVPDYAEYFDCFKTSPLQEAIVPGLLVESSRGCWWWGQGHTGCVFCGMNGVGKVFRSKSPDRVVDEMEQLSSTYALRRFEAVDTILDMTYFENVLPRLAVLNPPYDIFYETKANLSREQVRRLAAAGVHWIQPGIESLDDALLRLMNKGTTALINVQLLKYVCEFGVHVVWHLMFRFPGEADSGYGETAAWLPLIYHLQPPRRMTPVVFQRFSHYHQDPARYRLSLVPLTGYSDVYPLSFDALQDLAFYFQDQQDMATPGTLAGSLPGLTALKEAVQAWIKARAAYLPPVLSCEARGEGVEIFDTRPCAVERRVELRGLAARALRLCDPAVSRAGLLDRLRREEPDVTAAALDSALDELHRFRLLLELNGQCLSLAVPGTIPELRVGFPGGYLKGARSGYHQNC